MSKHKNGRQAREHERQRRRRARRPHQQLAEQSKTREEES